VIGRALRQWDDWLFPWLDGPPQTNEVARSGVLFPGMLEIARRFGPKLEILELGASGGLNLNMDRFAYDLGGCAAGDAGSPVRVAPKWSGPVPPIVPVEIVARAGVDLNPLDMTDADVADRMMAYIWPDQAERVARAQAAIALARQFPPPVERGDGADWIERRLALPQAEGVARVVYQGRRRVADAIKAAGRCASAGKPLAWLSMEFQSEVIAAELTLRCWPGDGAAELLARCHPHGAHVSWEKKSG
jgi:hypothetical protein